MPDSPSPAGSSGRFAPSHGARIIVTGLVVTLALTACAATQSAPLQAPSAPTSSRPFVTPSAASSESTTQQSATPTTPSRSATTVKPAAPTTPKDTRTGAALAKPFTVNGIPVISKKHPISAAHRRSSVTEPYGLTKQTQAALTTMISAAHAKGVTIRVRSGYRSYALQAQILASKIREYGSETMARRYNAAPGRSEHQTGLAVDLWDGSTWGVDVRTTRAGKWLWANAWRYGFILRYPNSKEKITGYAFEPWHYRWIGTADAKNFGPNTNLTLEEYLGLA